MRTLIDLFWATRPINAAMATVMVVASYKVASSSYENLNWQVVVIAIAAVLMVAGQAIFNDVMDVTVDRKQKSHRAITAGRLNRDAMLGTSMILSVASVTIAATVGVMAMAYFAISGVALIAYSALVKYRWGAAGTLLTSLAVTALCFTGCLIAGNWLNLTTIAIAVFFATMAREVAKDVEDLPGDEGSRKFTLPMLVGSQYATKAAIAFSVGQIVASYLPVAYNVLGMSYAAIVTVTNTLLVLLIFTVKLYRAEQAKLFQTILKVSMGIYLISYLID